MLNMIKNIVFPLSLLVILSACSDQEEKKPKKEMNTNPAKDHHSFSEPELARVTHLNWIAEVNFNKQLIQATANWTIKHNDADSIIFDTRNLEIDQVLLDGDQEADYKLGEEKEHLGKPLIVYLEPGTDLVSVTYNTTKGADALQWLTSEQTAGKEHPFLFTQSQAILARTWIPCQDSPGIRFTYEANVKVPTELLALMSATNPKEKSFDGIYEFKMEQPVPSYLMALAVGDLAYDSIGAKTGVYAEPSVLDDAAYEFANMDSMLVAAENMYGEYQWGRFDVLVLPPSFPFGGMENPKLTFATPTILAGDRSLTALIAHELAHSWSGNLVTNATWNDFWLNEGFTVYFERRIMEELYGESYAEMLDVLGKQDLEKDIKELPHDDTRLKLDLKGRNPDDGMNSIAYEKGNFFLKTIEKYYGREAFDEFLSTYFDTFAFQTVHTEMFREYLDSHLLVTDTNKMKKLRVDEWIYSGGLPDNAAKVTSRRLQRVESTMEAWQDGVLDVSEMKTDDWSTHEWLYLLRKLPDDTPREKLKELDEAFGFTQSGNNEILAAWFIHTIREDYTPAENKVEEFLINVGRRKFLVPIYKALIKADPSKETAKTIYEKARPNYHSVSRKTIDEMLNEKEN